MGTRRVPSGYEAGTHDIVILHDIRVRFYQRGPHGGVVVNLHALRHHRKWSVNTTRSWRQWEPQWGSTRRMHHLRLGGTLKSTQDATTGRAVATSLSILHSSLSWISCAAPALALYTWSIYTGSIFGPALFQPHGKLKARP